MLLISPIRTRARSLAAGALCAGLLVASSQTASAFGSGITGQSSNCSACHQGGGVPNVVISGPTSVGVGETIAFTLTVSGGAGGVCGLDVSTDLGSLVASDVGTRLQDGEITHEAPRAFSSGICSFGFDWTAPLGNASVTLSAAGMSANGNGGSSGDLAATTSLEISVIGGAIDGVDLVYNFGNASGSLSADIGAGGEFVIEGLPSQPPLFSATGTIDISADQLSLTHSRSTTLGPSLPLISDDFLTFTFLQPGRTITNVTLVSDPMPNWFAGLAFTDNSITLTQLTDSAGVSTQLKIWSIAFRSELSETEKLLALDGATLDQFGGSVAISGDTAVVGAVGEPSGPGPPGSPGSAYVFGYDGTDWVEQQKLIASDGAIDDVFGFSVAISGATIVVGARFDDDEGFDSGSAYVFRYDGLAWVEEAKLTASDAAAGNWFGTSVSIADDTIVVGTSVSGVEIGAAYVFRYDGAAWTEEAKLIASDGAAGDSFGTAVAIAGDTVAVGALFDDDNGNNQSGSVYVFRYDGADWVEESKLTASDNAASDGFGQSVAVAGDAIAVGALNIGSAYVFRFDGAAWVEEAKLTAADAGALDRFGSSVAIAGPTVIIGTRGAGDSGSAHVFRYDGTSWLEDAKLTASDAESGDSFGVSVALAGGTFVVGANGNDDNGTSSGSAYVFALPEPSAMGLHVSALTVIAGLTRRGRRDRTEFWRSAS